MNLIKIECDCGVPFYIDPDELNDSQKSMPLKCPFCNEPGAPVYQLLTEMSQAKDGKKSAS